MEKPDLPPDINGHSLHLRQMVEWAVDEIHANRKEIQRNNSRIDGIFKLIFGGFVSGFVGLMGIIGILVALVLRGV